MNAYRRGPHENKKSAGIYPRQPRAIGDQPLKPVSLPWGFWALISVLVAALMVVTVRNFEEISTYLNRPISTVRIVNPLQQLTESEVQALLAAYIGDGFFKIDVSSVQKQLEAHPWIARAEVKRVWPNSLTLMMTEEIAIARWGQTDLLNQYGKVFAPVRGQTMGSLPVLSGPAGSQVKVMEQYQILRQILFPAGLHLERLELSARGSWELGVSGGVKIIAGKSDLRGKVKRLMDIYDTQIRNDIAFIERIDLRYSNGFTVKKKPLDITGVAAR